jgi:hypothetical protein
MIAEINNNCNDFYLKVCLVRLLDVIRHDFHGHVRSENKISTIMKKKYGWGNKTTRKRLGTLESMGLITQFRSEEDQWTKEYLLREA